MDIASCKMVENSMMWVIIIYIFFQDDLSAPADAGGAPGTDIPGVPDYQRGTVSQIGYKVK